MHKLSELIIFQALLAIKILDLNIMIITKHAAFVNEGDIFVTIIVKVFNYYRKFLYIKYYHIYLKREQIIDIISQNRVSL